MLQWKTGILDIRFRTEQRNASQPFDGFSLESTSLGPSVMLAGTMCVFKIVLNKPDRLIFRFRPHYTFMSRNP